LVLLTEDSTDGVIFHGLFYGVEEADAVLVRSIQKYLTDGVCYVFAIINVVSQMSVDVDISEAVDLYVAGVMEEFILHSNEATKSGLVHS
jgi:hypothetical protein